MGGHGSRAASTTREVQLGPKKDGHSLLAMLCRSQCLNHTPILPVSIKSACEVCIEQLASLGEFVTMKLVDETRTSWRKYSGLTIFLVFSENDNHSIVSSGSKRNKQLASPSQSRPVPAIFSAATSWLTMSSKIPIIRPFGSVPASHIHSPHSDQRPSRTGVTANFVAHRCFTPSWFVVH